jgi:hypothetical protein
MIQSPSKHLKLYKISRDFNSLSDEDYNRKYSEDTWDDLWTDIDQYDIEVKKLNNNFSIQSIYNRQGWLDNPILPNTIVVFGWFDLLEKTEFPKNNLSWMIFSKRIIDLIYSLGVKPKLHSIRILERAQFRNIYSENVRKYEIIEYSENLTFRDDWFYGVQFPTFSVTSDDWNALDTKNIKWRELTEAPPAFFVDPKSPGELLITSEARDALEKAEIRGLRFTPPFSF